MLLGGDRDVGGDRLELARVVHGDDVGRGRDDLVGVTDGQADPHVTGVDGEQPAAQRQVVPRCRFDAAGHIPHDRAGTGQDTGRKV